LTWDNVGRVLAFASHVCLEHGSIAMSSLIDIGSSGRTDAKLAAHDAIFSPIGAVCFIASLGQKVGVIDQSVKVGQRGFLGFVVIPTIQKATNTE
jgi:hypothetical protein